MADRAVALIEEVDRRRMNFQWLRSTLKADNGLKDSLAWGHAVIDTPDKLDQYLYTYGPMIESQWENVAGYLAEIAQPTRLIDYGCGQGLAGVLMNDLTGGDLLSSVREIILIEPSAVALARAGALYGRIAPDSTVASICKRFDDLREGDVPANTTEESLHVFSNSLDVLGFDPLKLFTKTMDVGEHTILSVSHDRDFNGGTPRIEAVKAAFEAPEMASSLTIHRSSLQRFTCDNGSRGVSWICELEVRNG